MNQLNGAAGATRGGGIDRVVPYCRDGLHQPRVQTGEQRVHQAIGRRGERIDVDNAPTRFDQVRHYRVWSWDRDQAFALE